MTGRLGAFLDGQPLPEAEARALWERFSAYMDAHKGDLRGFATAEGYASVRPETRKGQAVLVLSRTAPQVPYGGAGPASPGQQGGGSGDAQKGPPATGRGKGGGSGTGAKRGRP
jgi:hypothetical protein